MTGTEWPVIRQRETRLEKKNLATLILLVAGLSAILLLVMGGKMSAANARIIAIVFSCILLWATAVIPGLLVSLLFFFFSWFLLLATAVFPGLLVSLLFFFSVDASNARTDCANILRLRIECILACILRFRYWLRAQGKRFKRPDWDSARAMDWGFISQSAYGICDPDVSVIACHAVYIQPHRHPRSYRARLLRCRASCRA